jgi:MFS family permease
MYTLEDDNETSSRLHKKDFLTTQNTNAHIEGKPEEEAQAGTFANFEAGVTDLPNEGNSTTSLFKRFSLKHKAAKQGTMYMALPPSLVESADSSVLPALPPKTEESFGTPVVPATPEAPQQSTNAAKQLTTTAKAGSQKVAFAALTLACIAVFFTTLDQTVVVTALPQIITDLHVPITQLDHAAWIVSAYLLGFVVVMPLMGRVSDIYGRRRIFLLCLTIFGLGSLLCALAPIIGDMLDLSFLSVFGIDTSSPGLVVLIAARLFQAIGGGAVVPVAMAIANDFYGKERRGLALGIIGAVTEAGGALGPLYGAIVVQHLGWQYIFYLNIPIVVGLMIAAWMLIPRGKRLREKIDWLGTLLLGLALTCLSLGLAQQGTSLGPTIANAPAPQNNPIAIGLAIAFFIAFVVVELRVRWPVVEVRLFKRLAFSATSLVSLFVGAALIIALADIPIFVDTVLQRPVLDSGLALLRLTVMIPLGAILGGWLCERISSRVTAILGLLFTAVGFYLMSLWPIHVDWTQITISTITAGLGFGLVIAPIGTTAINAVKARQAGVSSAIVTALRMVGMILGLAALTSWALAYFKQLASTYPSLPATASASQFNAWSKGYATHLIASAHTVYSAVFFFSMILCLIALVPAIFLWGRQLSVAEVEPEEEPLILTDADASDDIHDATTSTVGDTAVVPKNKRKRRRRIIIASAALIFLLVGGGILAAFLFGPDDSPDDNSNPIGGVLNLGGGTTAATPISGPRMIQLGLDAGALTSVFASQLKLNNGVLTDLAVTPMPNDGLVLNLNLHIDANGIHRVMPLEMDGTLGVDKQQNLSLSITHLRRDGIDAGPAAAAQMQGAMNQLITGSVMPALRGQLKTAQLISAHTSTTIACGKGTELLVLLIKAPPIQGVAAQPKPVPFCFKGPTDLNKLLPH